MSTALHLACANGHIGVVNYLVNKVNLFAEDRMGDKPIDDAKRSAHEDIVVYLNAILARELEGAPSADSCMADEDVESVYNL